MRPSEVVMEALERIVADYDVDPGRMAHVLADFHQWLDSSDDSPFTVERQDLIDAALNVVEGNMPEGFARRRLTNLLHRIEKAP